MSTDFLRMLEHSIDDRVPPLLALEYVADIALAA
jgi:hypothetical protein